MASKIPKVISIDAFNTLFVSKRPILKVYAELGQKYGFNLSEEQLSSRFPNAYNDMKIQFPNYGKSQKLNYEEWWSKLIIKLYDPIQIQQDFINELLTTFESSKGYAGYDDVFRFLEKYHGKNVVFVASSNGDPRVLKVLESLNLLKYFHKVYLSYDIELTKPSLKFFNYIIDDLLKTAESLKGVNKEEILKNAWHIGDELTNDLNGSVEGGWNGILIDRKKEYESLVKKYDEIELAKIKINTDFSNTSVKLSSSQENQDINTVLKLDEKRFVVRNFNQVSSVIGL